MLKIESRASVVLYNFLKGNKFKKPFLLPANVCPIVPCIFLKAKIDFEFVDIDKTYAIDQDRVFDLLVSHKYSGVLFVHSYGNLYNVDSLFKNIKEMNPDNCIIDDRCLCIPELTSPKLEFSDLVLFSTGYSKYVDLSIGGWGFINNRFSYQREQSEYRKNDLEDLTKQIKSCINLNSKLNYTDSFWLDLSEFTMEPEQYIKSIKDKLVLIGKHKEELNCIYSENISKEIQYPGEFNNWRFNIKVKNRKKTLDSIFQAGLFAGTNYPSIANIFKGQKAENAEYEGEHIINLFNDFRFDKEKALSICKVIDKILHI